MLAHGRATQSARRWSVYVVNQDERNKDGELGYRLAAHKHHQRRPRGGAGHGPQFRCQRQDRRIFQAPGRQRQPEGAVCFQLGCPGEGARPVQECILDRVHARPCMPCTLRFHPPVARAGYQCWPCEPVPAPGPVWRCQPLVFQPPNDMSNAAWLSVGRLIAIAAAAPPSSRLPES